MENDQKLQKLLFDSDIGFYVTIIVWIRLVYYAKNTFKLWLTFFQECWSISLKLFYKYDAAQNVGKRFNRLFLFLNKKPDKISEALITRLRMLLNRNFKKCFRICLRIFRFQNSKPR